MPTIDQLRKEAAQLGIRLPPRQRAADPGGADYDALRAAARDEWYASLTGHVDEPKPVD